MGTYIIEGDTADHNGCLIYLCGTKEIAANTLNRMHANPSESDSDILATHSNIRIGYVEHGWWDEEYKYLSND